MFRPILRKKVWPKNNQTPRSSTPIIVYWGKKSGEAGQIHTLTPQEVEVILCPTITGCSTAPQSYLRYSEKCIDASFTTPSNGKGGIMRLARGKNLFFLWFILIMLFLWPRDIWSKESDGKGVGEEGQGKVTFLQGKCEVLAKGETAWRLLKVGSLLSRDDEVRTRDKARIEIQLPDRSILRFDQRTTFKMKTVFFDTQDGSRDIKVEMTVGKTWANVRKVFGTKKTFELASANAVAGVRDTVWRMNVGLDKSTLIRVYEGTVEVYNPFVKPDYKPEEGGFKAPREVRGPQEIARPYEEVSKEQWEEIVLTQMMQIIVPPTGKPEKPVAFSEEDDQKEEWVRWNRQRDREIKS